MRLHRFFTDTEISGKIVILQEKDLIHQIAHVLRLTKGDEIILCNSKGYDAHVRITEVTKNNIKAEVLLYQKNTTEPSRHVTLYCSVLKKENFELVVQKAVEVGVKEIVPLQTKRTVKTGMNENRLKKIAKEAAEQCGRAWIPIVHAPVAFSDVISVILSAENDSGDISKERRDSLGSALRMTHSIAYDISGIDAREFFKSNGIRENIRIGIWIGPEGGWGADELKAFQEKGYTILSLGPRTLRAETAAIIGTFLAAV